MLTSNCRNVFFCPFAAESELIASQIKDCRKINSQTWAFEESMIFTWNGAGFLPMHKFLDCFPVEKLRTRNIFLFGSAGSVDDSHQPGQIFSVSQIKFEELSLELKPLDSLPQILALTKDSPVHSEILRKNIFKLNGSCLIDQESYHFVDYFKKLQINAAIIRFVSDTPSFPFRIPFVKELKTGFSNEWKRYCSSIL